MFLHPNQTGQSTDARIHIPQVYTMRPANANLRKEPFIRGYHNVVRDYPPQEHFIHWLSVARVRPNGNAEGARPRPAPPHCLGDVSSDEDEPNRAPHVAQGAGQ